MTLYGESPFDHQDKVSAEVPDWSREGRASRTGKLAWTWNPSRSLLASLRDYEALRGAVRVDLVLRRRVAVLRHRFWSVVTGAEVTLGARIEGGLLMPHPNGIVIHPDARIGPNCLLLQQVTLGMGGTKPGAPTLIGHVDVGAGAKILGGVTIGAHAVIGANAVVLIDVPAGATAVGVPARILPPRATRKSG
ncbi:MAG: serine acetyltransferase [Pseudomonadota bacterium]|nr:serine acetyltransferase [Pseudomonadota bacterium]